MRAVRNRDKYIEDFGNNFRDVLCDVQLSVKEYVHTYVMCKEKARSRTNLDSCMLTARMGSIDSIHCTKHIYNVIVRRSEFLGRSHDIDANDKTKIKAFLKIWCCLQVLSVCAFDTA